MTLFKSADARLVRVAQLSTVAAAMTVATLLVARTSMASLAAEAEPNNDQATATPILDGESGIGNIDPIGEVDTWVRADGVAGQLVFAFVDTADSTMSTDSELGVRSNVFALFDSDDSDGPGASSAIAGAEVPLNGNVFFRVREDGNNAEITPYVLYQTLIHPAEGSAEVEPNEVFTMATPISSRMTTAEVSGADVDFFAFTAQAGDAIVVIMDDDPDKDGLLTDTEMAILDSDGVTVLADGDDGSTRDANAAGAIFAPADGTYYVRVSDGTASADTEYRFVVLVEDEPACLDENADGLCDALEPCSGIGDSDGDGVCNDVDICLGDDATGDSDGDGFCDDSDNCPTAANPGQEDADLDGVGDVCAPPVGPCGVGVPFAPMALMALGVSRLRRRRSHRAR